MAADQQFDEAGWKSIVDQMAGKGASATEAEFEQIVTRIGAEKLKADYRRGLGLPILDLPDSSKE